jgi:signal transduction histidine kinase/CheY-like chemotaxis protein
MKIALVTVQIRYERDVVLCRQRARQIAEQLGFERQDQVRIATTISELARNVFQYAKRGKVEFSCDDANSNLQIVVSDEGPGIANIKEILRGNYVSKTGMGVGLLGAKRLMDGFKIETAAGKGTTISIVKNSALPTPLTSKQIRALTSEIAMNRDEDPFHEIQRQNQELLSAMEELQQRKSELDQLNRELEDTNRGVVALYAELDEKADYLRRASEIKSRFLSNMTHEFRTPLNSILGLSRMLLDRVDGDLSVDQEKQVSFIRKAASDLSELVNDLLDLSKVEAGKVSIRPTEFEIKDMFGALRGMLRPLLSHNTSIDLVFDEPKGIPAIYTDEAKVSQILRNFIANALKYTERGEVRVSATLREDNVVVISVKDTGIGIAPEDVQRIFDEFVQVEGPHQKKAKGTGLGLSLSKKLAEVLGGSVTVESAPGVGSEFSVILPLAYRGDTEITYVSEIVRQIEPSRAPVLVVDDNTETLFIYESFLKGTRFQSIPVRSIKQAREALKTVRPKAIILDILLEHENTWGFLVELKRDKSTRDIPVYVVTMVENEKKARQSGANDFHLKPISREWLLQKLDALLPAVPAKKLLIIDDNEASRYLLRGLLSGSVYQMIEAAGGHDGLRLVAEEKPDAVFLDLDMPDIKGLDVLKQLEQKKQIPPLPVILYTANSITPEEMEPHASVVGVLSKDFSSRETSLAQVTVLLEKAHQLQTVTKK